jgi:hypothetical protein
MITAIIALVLCLVVSSSGQSDRLAFYERFKTSLNTQQKSEYERLKKEDEARQLKELRAEAAKLSVKYMALTGKEFPFDLNDTEKLRNQVRGVNKFLEERRQAQQASDYQQQQDVASEQWQERQRQFKLRQLETELEDARRQLRKQ